MKRKLISILLLCCCAASLLVTRAAASEDIDIATGDALMRIATSGTTKYQGLFSDSWSYSVSSTQTTNSSRYYMVVLPVSIQGNHTYIYTLNWNETYYSVDSYLTAPEFFDYIKVTRGNETVEIDLANENTDFDGFSMYRTVSSSGGSSGYIRHVSVSFVVDDPTITNFSFYTQTHDIHEVHTSPITITDVSDATLDDVLAQLVKLTTATNSSAAASASAMKDSIYELQTALGDTMSSLQESNITSMAALKETVNKMIEEMPGAVQEGTKGALQEFFEELKQEASDKLSSSVNELSEKMPVNVAALQTSFNQLYNSLTNHSTNATLKFPAGTVTLMGNTYTFWDASDVSFDEFFSLPIVTLLLLPLRFIFVFGMGKYLISYFDKLVKLITLHIQGGS